MQPAPHPANEPARLAALRSYAILDTPQEESYDAITKIASEICGTPIALISLIDEERQWFKSRVGLDARETSRDLAFCAHAIHGRKLLQVPNALLDERFCENPLVTGAPNIRFYAGMPLETSDGHALGTLCVIDRRPRELTAGQEEALKNLGVLVTQQLELRRALRANRALLQEKAAAEMKLAHFAALVDSAEDAVMSKTLDGVVQSWNPASERMFGYTAQEMIGQPMTRLFPPERFDEESVILERIRQGDRLKHFETVRLRKDGSRVAVSVTISPIRSANGEILGASKIVRDITAQKALVDEVAATNRELEDFAYVVSHDLKAPLRGIGTLAEWLVADYADKIDDAGREQFQLMTKRVMRLDALINGILAYSRVSRAREQKMTIDLDEIARNVVDMLAPPPHIQIIFETRLPKVQAEPTKAQQLLQNLLSNAIKFCDKPAGLICVRCEAENDHWHFSIADNGLGIEEKYFHRVFELFETLAPRDEVEGTGVGLAIVKKIVETGGGRVWLESTCGVGTTVHFSWPRIGNPA
jgi:two-component system sensor kinase FixL